LLGLNRAGQHRDPHQQHEDSSLVYHNGVILARGQLPRKVTEVIECSSSWIMTVLGRGLLAGA
jgi:hypothetical protein